MLVYRVKNQNFPFIDQLAFVRAIHLLDWIECFFQVLSVNSNSCGFGSFLFAFLFGGGGGGGFYVQHSLVFLWKMRGVDG